MLVIKGFVYIFTKEFIIPVLYHTENISWHEKILRSISFRVVVKMPNHVAYFHTRLPKIKHSVKRGGCVCVCVVVERGCVRFVAHRNMSLSCKNFAKHLL